MIQAAEEPTPFLGGLNQGLNVTTLDPIIDPQSDPGQGAEDDPQNEQQYTQIHAQDEDWIGQVAPVVDDTDDQSQQSRGEDR
jgi:hypothetical protein